MIRYVIALMLDYNFGLVDQNYVNELFVNVDQNELNKLVKPNGLYLEKVRY